MEKAEKIKPKSIFDHINHIREVQDPNYYSDLSDSDKGTFNIYMILRILSMDKSLIDSISYISKYTSNIPIEHFYKLLIQIIPRKKKYCKYIKNTKSKKQSEILTCIINYYNISRSQAEDYHDLMKPDSVKELLMDYGYSQEDISKLVA